MTADKARAMTDDDLRELFNLFREGDSEAYQNLFLYLEFRLQPMVSPALRLDYPRVGEKADTGDIRHETLCRLIQYLRKQDRDFCEGVIHFQRLTARVLRHTLIDLKRKHFGPVKIHTLAEDAGEYDAHLAESSGLDGWRTRMSIHELVDKLDPDSQRVIELAIYADIKNADLARHLGVSAGHATRLFARAKEKLGDLVIEEKRKTF